MAADIYVSALLDVYGPILSDKQFRILDGYYNNDLSLSEIAENEGITRQGVSDFVRRTEAQLYELEDKLHIYKTLSSIKNTATLIKSGQNNVDDLLTLIDNL